jgi:hypothetical protein
VNPGLIGRLMSISDNNNNKIINSRGLLFRMSPRAFTTIRTLSSWSSSMVCYTLPSKPLCLISASVTTHLLFFSFPYLFHKGATTIGHPRLGRVWTNSNMTPENAYRNRRSSFVLRRIFVIREQIPPSYVDKMKPQTIQHNCLEECWTRGQGIGEGWRRIYKQRAACTFRPNSAPGSIRPKSAVLWIH